jgi:hypothetical protein
MESMAVMLKQHLAVKLMKCLSKGQITQSPTFRVSYAVRDRNASLSIAANETMAIMMLYCQLRKRKVRYL